MKTPVWFVQDGPRLYVRTGAESGKVKRVRNDGRVRVRPSDAMGAPRGEWVDGTARLVEAEEADRASRLADAQVRRHEDRLRPDEPPAGPEVGNDPHRPS